MVFCQSIDLGRSTQITTQEIAYAVDHRIRYIRPKVGATESKSSRLLFIHIATEWLRFCGYLVTVESAAAAPFGDYIENFINYMRDERGLSNATITFNGEQLTHFLLFAGPNKVSLKEISIHDIDAYLVHQGSHGWSRRSLRPLAGALRAFFRYAETQGWVKGIAIAIDLPPVYAQENLSLGPRWEDVKRLIVRISLKIVTQYNSRLSPNAMQGCSPVQSKVVNFTGALATRRCIVNDLPPRHQAHFLG